MHVRAAIKPAMRPVRIDATSARRPDTSLFVCRGAVTPGGLAYTDGPIYSVRHLVGLGVAVPFAGVAARTRQPRLQSRDRVLKCRQAVVPALGLLRHALHALVQLSNSERVGDHNIWCGEGLTFELRLDSD